MFCENKLKFNSIFCIPCGDQCTHLYIYFFPLSLSEESVYKSDQNTNLIFQWPELFDLVFHSFFNSRLSIALTWLSKLFDPLEQLESEFDWDNFES